MNTTSQVNTKHHGAKNTELSRDEAIQEMLSLDYVLRVLTPKFPHSMFSTQVVNAQYLNFDEFYRANRHRVDTSHLPNSDSAVATVAVWFLINHILFKLDHTDMQEDDAILAMVKQSMG